MSRVLVLVEGRTEQTFVQNILAPELGVHGLYLSARLVGKPGYKGGIGNYKRARRDILTILRQDSNIICTTMFDYYGMPDSWPGRRDANTKAFLQKAALVENAVAKDIVQKMGEAFNQNRFLPYVQMHEFEALLFSDPKELGAVISGQGVTQKLQAITDSFKNPEEINDSAEKAPSKRLLGISAGYRKVVHGNIVAKRIGLSLMRKKCHHFNEWVTILASLDKQGIP